MNIIIVGGGKVGLTLSEQLAALGNDITILDTDPEVISRATNTLDVRGVEGSGTSYKAQMEAGITEADVLIAVTGSDEINLLSCLIAKKAGSKCKTISRVRGIEYYSEINFIKHELGLALSLNPDFAVATEIERLIQIPSALEVDTFAKGRVTIIRVQIPPESSLDNLKLSELHTKVSEDILVCIVERGDEVIIPNGTTVLRSGDYISVIMPLYLARPILHKIGIDSKPVKKTMIAGGGKITYHLAKKLIAANQQVKIIERDFKRCEELSELLPEAVIICGDASDESVLFEEGIRDMDAFVALTNFDEGNILVSLYAHETSDAKIITKISKISFEKILTSLPIGTPVFPKQITAERILRYVRAIGNSTDEDEIQALYKLVGGKAEALELFVERIPSNENLINVPIRKLNIRDDIILGCVNKQGRLVTPKGSDVIEVGDTVIVVTTQTNRISRLADIIAK